MTTQTTIALDARNDLHYAGQLTTDDDTNDRLVEAFETAYRTVAEQVGRDTFDADVTVIDYDPAAGNTGDEMYDEDGQPTLAGKIWQAAHDAIDVTVNPDGTWTITTH
jgi:hypothetical protein